MKLGQGPSEADFGQDPGRFVRQDGPESQDLLIPRRGDAGIDPDNAAKLVFADLADHITGKDFDAVQELHRVVAAGDWPGQMPNGPGTLPFFGLNNHLPFFIGYINKDKDTQSVFR